jgi:hypothetical protein
MISMTRRVGLLVALAVATAFVLSCGDDDTTKADHVHELPDSWESQREERRTQEHRVRLQQAQDVHVRGTAR